MIDVYSTDARSHAARNRALTCRTIVVSFRHVGIMLCCRIDVVVPANPKARPVNTKTIGNPRWNTRSTRTETAMTLKPTSKSGNCPLLALSNFSIVIFCADEVISLNIIQTNSLYVKISLHKANSLIVCLTGDCCLRKVSDAAQEEGLRSTYSLGHDQGCSSSSSAVLGDPNVKRQLRLSLSQLHPDRLPIESARSSSGVGLDDARLLNIFDRRCLRSRRQCRHCRTDEAGGNRGCSQTALPCLCNHRALPSSPSTPPMQLFSSIAISESLDVRLAAVNVEFKT